MTTVVRTRSRGIYTSGTQLLPLISLDCVGAHPNSPQSATPLQSNQVAQISGSKIRQDALLPLIYSMTADEQDIGSYKVFSNLHPESFVALQLQLKQRGLSYIYRAPKEELIVMVPSNLHEHVIQSFADYIRSVMCDQRSRNPELGEYWTLHTSKGAFFVQALDGRTTFQSDLGIFINNEGLFQTEVTFTQRWDDILEKVEHIVEGAECWGVLVVKIDEVDKWGGKPTRRMANDDFIPEAEWLAQARASRDDDPYGPVCVQGMEWTKAVNVQICFFEHAWRRADGLPMMHQLNATGDIDFRDLDDELATVWHRMVEHVGELYDITVQPVAFAIPWKDVRKCVVAGLVLTGHARYEHWGDCTYRKRRQSEMVGRTIGPSKFKKPKTN